MKKLLLLFSLFYVGFSYAQVPISLSEFASGLDEPVSMAHAGDSRLFVVERAGRIMIIDSSGTLSNTPFLDIRADVLANRLERGLLGLAFHPEYDQNGYFYVNYTRADGRTRVSRFSRDPQNPNVADIQTEDVLLEVSQPFANHNAGDIAFGPDGYLYVTMGDGGSAGDPGNRAQNMKSYLGKILRLDVEVANGYAIPPDNPFVNDTSVLDEIWSSGWRNPWRFSFDKQTGDLWVADVGQSQYEEISVEWAGSLGGLNFGWRCTEGNVPFNGTGCGSANLYTPPLHTYRHGFNTGKSITGGYVYRGEKYVPLQGHYIYGDYESGNIWSLVPAGGGQYTEVTHGKLLDPKQISTFGQDASGELYVTGYDDGKIYQINSITSSVDPGADPFGIEVYPNPSEGSLVVKLENPPLQPYEILIHQLDGKTVKAFSEGVNSQAELDLSDLSSGIYLLEIKGERSAFAKIVRR